MIDGNNDNVSANSNVLIAVTMRKFYKPGIPASSCQSVLTSANRVSRLRQIQYDIQYMQCHGINYHISKIVNII